MVNKKYILASGSPRRRELMAMLDLDFRVDTSKSVEEIVPEDLQAEKVPGFLSRLKAQPYLRELKPNEVLITADTIVILNGKVIGKPQNECDAHRILSELSGQVHQVITGVTVSRYAEKPETFSEVTEVEFDTLTDEEIAYYVDKYQPMDKAGAYGIQEWIGAAAVKGIRGSFYNVMGLPIHRLYCALKK